MMRTVIAWLYIVYLCSSGDVVMLHSETFKGHRVMDQVPHLVSRTGLLCCSYEMALCKLEERGNAGVAQTNRAPAFNTCLHVKTLL